MPSFVLSERTRRRPNLDNAQYYDQLGQGSSSSTTWPERYVSSASHTQTQTYQDKGDVRHSNFILTVTPKRPRNIGDLPLKDNLDDARSAEEYVQKAMSNHQQFGGSARKRIPSSTYSKYNLIAEPVAVQVKEEPYYNPPAKQAYRYSNQLQHDYQKVTPKVPSQPLIQKDVYPTAISEIMKSNDHSPAQYHQDRPVKHHVIKIVENIAPSAQSSLSAFDKSEIMSQIEESVLKMFKELERKQKREDKNRLRLKEPISVQFSTQMTSTTSTKTPPHRHNKDDFSPNVDLTFKHPKHRPRPIDLSALDVGQSWNHGTAFDHGAILKTAQGFDSTNAVPIHHQETTVQHQGTISHRKPHKLHFNQQTYHDINALPYTSGKNRDDEQYHKGYTYSDTVETSGGLRDPYKDDLKSHEASVGATISFGQSKQPEYNIQIVSSTASPNELNPIHIINGIPVSNPYKMDINAIRYMLNGLSQVQAQPYDDQTSDDEINAQTSNWEPFTTNPKPTNLPYDSYSPRYNKNPKGYGYQEDYEFHTPHITNAPPSDSSSTNQKRMKNKKIKNDGSQYKWNQNTDDKYAPSASSQTSTWSTGTDQYGSSTTTKIRVQRVPKGKRSHANRSSLVTSTPLKSGYGTRGSSNKDSSLSKTSRDLETELRPPPRYLQV